MSYRLARPVSMTYRPNGFGLPVWNLELPEGLRVTPADNLPGDRYWLAEAPEGASDDIRDWIDRMGILVDADEVEDF